MFRVPRRTTLTLVVVVLLSVTGVGAVGLTGAFSADASGPPEVVQVTNSTNYITAGSANITRQEYEEASLDVGAAMVADAERLEARHDELVFEEQRDAAVDSDTAARGITRVVEQRVSSLDDRQQQLFANYSSGELSTETLLTELVGLEVAAREQRQRIEELQDQEIPDDVAERLEALSVETTLLRAPVSERVTAAKTEGSDPVRVYVASSPDSLVASSVLGDRYVRQATLRGERDRFGEDLFAEDSRGRAQVARVRGIDFYGTQPDTVRGFRNTRIYEYRANHTQGELFAYLDGATRNPFHEYQFKQPVVDVAAETTSNTGESFRMNVQYTDATGPMAISLLGTGSESPPAVDISVDGQPVGTVEGGGQLWTIQPVGGFTVAATTEDGETVSVRVAAL